MTFYVENETDYKFPFDIEQILKDISNAALTNEGCEYDVQINLLITDGQGIRECNREFRDIDKETDVLSFPAIDFLAPGDFSAVDTSDPSAFDPENGELLLGDIMINYERVIEQAESYGHSLMREFAFLVAHSIFHLCGYDHMQPGEAAVMEEKQEWVLAHLGITRD